MIGTVTTESATGSIDEKQGTDDLINQDISRQWIAMTDKERVVFGKDLIRKPGRRLIPGVSLVLYLLSLLDTTTNYQ